MNTKVKNRWLLLICFLVYSVSYIGKNSYSTNIQNVITSYQVSKAYAGYVTSAFFFCYGAGQLLNGIFCEKFNSKWTVSLALTFSAGITVSMFFLRDILVMAILWGLNGLILSVLWCHCIKLLATVKEEGYLGKAVTTMSLTLPTGIVAAYGVSALFTALGIWRYTFLLAGVSLLGIAIVFFLVVNKTEQVVEEETVAQQTAPTEKKNSLFAVFGLAVAPLFLACICVGVLRDGAASWMPVLLSDTYAMPDSFSILLALGLPLTGVFTAVLSTKLINWTKNAFLSCLVAALPAVILCLLAVFFYDSSVVVLVALFMLLSVSAYITTNTMTSVLPLYYKDKLKSGQAAGIIDAFIYIGSACSTLFVGDLVDGYGWKLFMFILLGAAILITFCSLGGKWLLTRKL